MADGNVEHQPGVTIVTPASEFPEVDSPTLSWSERKAKFGRVKADSSHLHRYAKLCKTEVDTYNFKTDGPVFVRGTKHGKTDVIIQLACDCGDRKALDMHRTRL